MTDPLAPYWATAASDTFSLSYYAPEIEAKWTFDDDEYSGHGPGLQVVYQRDLSLNGKKEEENFWLYLTPYDAARVGAILTAYGKAHSESAPWASPVSVRSIPVDVYGVDICGNTDGVITRVSHDGYHIFVRQSVDDGEGRKPDEVELSQDEAVTLAHTLLGMVAARRAT